MRKDPADAADVRGTVRVSWGDLAATLAPKIPILRRMLAEVRVRRLLGARRAQQLDLDNVEVVPFWVPDGAAVARDHAEVAHRLRGVLLLTAPALAPPRTPAPFSAGVAV